MKLAIYETNGEITNIHELNENEDFTKRIEFYNNVAENKDKGRTVRVESFEDDSSTAWLFKEKMNKKNDFRNELVEIACAASSLVDRLRWVEGELDKMGDW